MKFFGHPDSVRNAGCMSVTPVDDNFEEATPKATWVVLVWALGHRWRRRKIESENRFDRRRRGLSRSRLRL